MDCVLSAKNKNLICLHKFFKSSSCGTGFSHLNPGGSLVCWLENWITQCTFNIFLVNNENANYYC